MKKLFLLIIASWATSCLPVRDTQSFSASAQTKAFTETKKKNILKKSLGCGALFGAVGIAVPLLIPACSFVSAVPLGIGIAVMCSLLQDRYLTSEDDKKNTIFKKRMAAHATGIVLVNAGKKDYTGKTVYTFEADTGLSKRQCKPGTGWVKVY